MLKAIGLGSKKPKDADLRAARQQAALVAQWRRDAAKLRAIVDKLRTAYTDAKGGFAVGRYEHIKDMLKEAVESYRNVAKEMKDEKMSGSLSRVNTADGSGSSVGGTLERQKKTGGLMARLRQSAQSFATHSDNPDEADAISRIDEMNAKELESEMERMRKELLQLKGEFYAIKDKLEWLATEYQASKKLNPTQRYAELKKMAKSVIRDSYGPKKD